MEEYLIRMALAILFSTIRNPKRQAEFQAALLKLRNELNLMFFSEPVPPL